MRIGDVWISLSKQIKCANDVEIEETSLCNCEKLCIFALEFKDPMTAHNNIAKSPFYDAFFSKSSDGNPWSDTYFCARYNRKTTFPFTGKERDRETGFSYFGARYYDSDLSGLFLSVDPMSDKYPSISPYAYCAWNPIIFVDPNGMIIDSTSLTDKIKATIQSNPTFANACDALAKDPENTYSFNKWDKPKIENDRQINGEVTFDGEKVFINYIETSDNFALFEEVGHAQQVVSGDIGFAEVTKDGILQWGTIGLDCQDEINAKQWAATAAGRKKTIFSIDDLINDGYNVDKLGSTSRTAYQDYKAYLNRYPGLTEAEFNNNGMIQHKHFHFIKKEK